jgi:hypothetical protein
MTHKRLTAWASGVLISLGATAVFAQSQLALPVLNTEPMDIGECRAPTSYAGTAKVLTCSCPSAASDKNSSSAAWGTDVYTADSYICKTARHAGVIGTGGGQVTLQMLPGQSSYVGTTRNGETTKAYGKYSASYRYVITTVPGGGDSGFSAVVDLPEFDMSMVYSKKKSKSIGALLGSAAGVTGNRQVQETANVTGQILDRIPANGVGAEYIGECTGLPPKYRKKPGKLLSCTCPASPSESSPIWGTGVYSGDSYICKSAIHAGAISRSGGRVAFQTLADQSSYAGSTHNGVTSIDYGPTRRLGAYRFVR